MRTAALLFAVGLLLPASASSAQTLRLLPSGTMPPGTTFSILVDDQDPTPEAITADADGILQYRVAHAPGKWRSEPILVVDVPERELGLSHANAMSLQLAFSFKATQAEESYDIPIEIFKASGTRERDRIDQLESFKQFEQILLAQGLTRHFLQQIASPGDGATRRMAKRWFDSVFNAISTTGRPLRMAPFIVDTARVAFQGDGAGTKYLETMTVRVRSLAWNDAGDLAGLLERKECGLAQALIGYLRTQNKANPGGAALRLPANTDPEAMLNELDAKRKAACP